MRSNYLVLALVFFAIGIFSCNKNNADLEVQKNNAPLFNNHGCDFTVVVSKSGPGGNASCPTGYEKSTGKMDVGEDIEFGVEYTTDDGLITWSISTDGKYLTWSGSVCGMTVVVKGGPASHIYTYSEDECNGGSMLHSPVMKAGKNNKIPAISNLQFCYNECISDLPENCNNETGYGGNSEGGGHGAWWYYFDTKGPDCQDIYAGQKLVAGASVCYNGSTLTINLGPGNSLQAGNETVKVQAYNGSAPDSRPPSGQFNTYKGTSLTVPVPVADFYVIHLDMVVCLN